MWIHIAKRGWSVDAETFVAGRFIGTRLRKARESLVGMGAARIATACAAVAAAITTAITTAGCSGGDGDRADPPTGGAASVITVTSSAFDDGQPIPRKYGCDGDGVSPPLAWSGVPDDAATLALVVDDPDAPGGTYVHWVVVNIDPAQEDVDEGGVPRDGVEIDNSSGDALYDGPCPPSGTHHYRFTVYALKSAVDLSADDALDAVFKVIESASIAQGTLTGTYSHP
jgi:Raf kinase inhibitor-like YbhB/YbcL family protein